VLAVLFYHLSDYCPVDSVPAVKLKMVLRGGWCGVDLFFVLSGFLITGILLDTQNAQNYFRGFYARRALRIFPIYYAALTLVLLTARFTPALDGVLPPAHDRMFYFLYLNNWWVLLHGAWRANVIGHFWSLAVEEQFYLAWPLIVWRLSIKSVMVIAISGIVLAPAIRVVLYAHWGAIRDIVENPFCRMDSLLMGALLASLVRSPNIAERLRSIFGWMAATAAIAVVVGNFSNSAILRLGGSPLFIFSGLAVAFGCLILHVFTNRNPTSALQRILSCPALTACGKYSYGMYIYHVPLLWICTRWETGLKPADDLLAFVSLTWGVTAVTFAAAKVSYDCFEMRFLTLKTRYAAT